MDKNFGLSHTEKEIMELLWQSEEPLSFREILDHANEYVFAQHAKSRLDWLGERKGISSLFSNVYKRRAHSELDKKAGKGDL